MEYQNIHQKNFSYSRFLYCLCTTIYPADRTAEVQGFGETGDAGSPDEVEEDHLHMEEAPREVATDSDATFEGGDGLHNKADVHRGRPLASNDLEPSAEADGASGDNTLEVEVAQTLEQTQLREAINESAMYSTMLPNLHQAMMDTFLDCSSC